MRLRQKIISKQIAWPRFGVAQDEAFRDQPPQSTPHAQNARLKDSLTGRDRGAKRAGSRAWLDAALPARIQEMLAVVYPNKTQDYSIIAGKNLLQESPAHDYGSDYWTRVGVTITPDATEDALFPSGKADLVADSDAGAFGTVSKTLGPLVAGRYLLSAYTKTSTALQSGLRLVVGASGRGIRLNHSDGAFVESGTAPGGAGVQPLGGGVYRFWVYVDYDGASTIIPTILPDMEETASTKAAYFDAVKFELIEADQTEPTSFTAGGIGTIWQRDNPDKSSCTRGAVDLSNNIYALYGSSGLMKLSFDGGLIWTHKFPVNGDAHVGSLCLDEEGNVYAAVSGKRQVIGGGEPTNGFVLGAMDNLKLWRYRQDYRSEDEGNQESALLDDWVLERGTDGLFGFVVDMKAQDGKLYTLQCDNEQWKAWLVVYEGTSLVYPKIAFKRQIAYPANSIDVSASGDILVSCQHSTERGKNPLSVLARHGLVGWTPLDLDKGIGGIPKHRIHSWYSLDDLSTDIVTDQGVDPGDGARIVMWKDRSGNGRHLVWDPAVGEAPFLRTRGLDGRPCISFDGTMALVSMPNPSENSDFKDGQLTSVPLYQDLDNNEKSGQYAFVGLFRPDWKQTPTGPVVGDQMLFFEHEAATTGTAGSAVIGNRAAHDTASTGAATVPNAISYYYRTDATDPADGTATGQHLLHGFIKQRDPNLPLTVDPTDPAQIALVSIINDNGVDLSPGSASRTRMLFRVNGRTYDRATAEKDTLHGKGRFYLGKPRSGGPFASVGTFQGEVYEMIAFTRRSDTLTGLESVISHPIYPDKFSGTASQMRVATLRITNPGSGAGAFSASGSVTLTGNPVGGDWVQLVDGVGNTRRFFFYAGGVLPAGNIKVVIGSNLTATAQNLTNAINAASTVLSITATKGAAGLVNLLNDNPGTQGNQAITELDSGGNITLVGMSGGTAVFVGEGVLTFSGGGAALQATGSWGSSGGGFITSVKLKTPGIGYSAPPSVAFTGWGGAGAAVEIGMLDLQDLPTNLEKVEGYVMHRHGVGAVLADALHYELDNKHGGKYHWIVPHPYQAAVPESDETRGLNGFRSTSEILALFDSSGKLLDTLYGNISGLGLGCRFAKDGRSAYTAGFVGASWDGGATSDDASYRKIAIDDDNTLRDTGDGTWKALEDHGQLGPYVGMAVDAFDNLVAPCFAPGSTEKAAVFFVLRGSDGVILEEFKYGFDADNQGTHWVAISQKVEKGNLVANAPDYEEDLVDPVSDWVAIFGENKTYADEEGQAELPMLEGKAPGAVRLYRMVSSTPNGVAPTTRVIGAISGGDLYQVSEGGLGVLRGDGLLANPNTGQGYVHSAFAYNKGFFVDRSKTLRWDPKKDTVEPWKASKGKVPERCPIVELWRGRMVLTGDGTGAVHMSRLGDPDDFNFGAPTGFSTNPTSFTLGEIGDVKDIVTGFCPFNDDLAILFGDRTVWLLSGDPRAGGQLDLLTDQTGAAFGRAWCKDPWGRVWFIGRRGGLWVMAGPRSIPVRASVNTIQGRLEAVDQSKFYFRLVYDWEQEGIVISVLPYGAPATSQESFFVELIDDQDAAFWPDKISSVAKQTTAILVVDGNEPSDRFLLTGHGDGMIRALDKESADDDGEPIECFCRMGPFHLGEQGREIMPVRLHATFAHDQDGVAWNVYVSDSPDLPGAPTRSGVFGPGRNQSIGIRGLGTYLWVELVQSATGQRFALEELRMDFVIKGRQKQR